VAARNNMRLMLKGDMAFFYHSNCKVPGIVGTMEIVQEHSIDGKLVSKKQSCSYLLT
jgi:predicted RNA-binding protein with PUA-like domain